MNILQPVLLAVVTLTMGACAARPGSLRPVPDSHAVQQVAADRMTDPSDRGLSPSAAEPVMPSIERSPAADAVGSAEEVERLDAAGSGLGVDASSQQGVPHSGAVKVDALHEAEGVGLEAELVAADLYADTVIQDPWERYNRRVHRINNAIDEAVLRPLAIAYTQAVPGSIRSGVSRFFGNLGTPATAVNQLLQGRPVHALQSVGRFAINSMIGIGGVLDPATRMGMRPRGNEDFGQTFARWGWRDSRYLVMPLLGPRTVRDSAAILVDQQLSPIGYVNDRRTAAALQVLDIVDGRSHFLPLDEARREAYDEYALVRDAWAQRRRHQIEQDLPGSD